MTYPALTDRRIPYDADGTVVAWGNTPAAGITAYPTGTQLAHMQDFVSNGVQFSGSAACVWFFFPGEQREVTAFWIEYADGFSGALTVQGSNDTTNGTDGTWETATLSSGAPPEGGIGSLDAWRSGIKPISFSGAKAVIRIYWSSGGVAQLYRLHLYGHKNAGQTPDDVIFLDSDDGGAEFTAPEDFGDRPLGTTVTRQFKVKNASATKTANNIVIACNDADFIISTDGITWVTSITVTLAAGATSATYYTRNTTPAPGATLGPRDTRITATVGSWT